MPDDLVLGPQESVDEAQRLLDEGMPFHAHEVLEAAWKTAEPAQRELWRGLAQLAVGLTHLQRGNARGAVALLRRGAEHLVHWQVGWTGPPRVSSPSMGRRSPSWTRTRWPFTVGSR